MFENPNEDYSIYKIDQQYQSFSSRILFSLDEYLEKIRLELTELMTENYEVGLSFNFALGSKVNPNNECNVFIKEKLADIEEVFDQLIKKHKDLKNIDFVLKGVESVTYDFMKIIIKTKFIESPTWIKNKSSTINPLNSDNVFSILYHHFFVS